MRLRKNVVKEWLTSSSSMDLLSLALFAPIFVKKKKLPVKFPSKISLYEFKWMNGPLFVEEDFYKFQEVAKHYNWQCLETLQLTKHVAAVSSYQLAVFSLINKKIKVW